MKPFEEQYTAWIDGRLTAAELEEFDRALPDRAAAEADRAQARGCGEFLRRHAQAPSLSNADFFSHQLRERLAAEGRLTRPAETPRRERWFTWPGLAWACGLCVVTSGFAYQMGQSDRFHRVARTSTPALESGTMTFDTQIIKTSAVDPTISATNVNLEDGMTVLWLDGMDYLPASYKLQ